MSTLSTIRETAKAASPGTMFGLGDFAVDGSRAAVESALSRLVRSGDLCRVRRGIYFRPAVSRFGVGGVSGVAAALKYAGDRAAGPAGATAAAMLGLSSLMPALSEVAVVGRPPTSIPGVRFRERSNMKRVAMRLKPKEIAVLELARDDFALVEVPVAAMKRRFRALVSAGEIDPERINGALIGEPSAVRRNVARLLVA